MPPGTITRSYREGPNCEKRPFPPSWNPLPTTTDRLAVINTLDFERTELVELPAGMPAQQTSSTGQPLGIVSAPAMGYAVLEPAARPPSPVGVTQHLDGFTLENEFTLATFDLGGRLTSLFDKSAGRECIQPGRHANSFILYDDNPVNFDAWDVDIYHLEKSRLVAPAHTAQIIEAGPLRAALAFEVAISPKSVLRQVVSLTALSPRLEFDTRGRLARRSQVPQG